MRLQTLISQQKREYVKGGWNETENKRDMIQLASLKPELQRRFIYFYPTKKQCDSRLVQFEEKERLLLFKQSLLDQAITKEDEAKLEYNLLLTELRDPKIKSLYSSDNLQSLKQQGKEEWKHAELKRKTLQEEIIRLKKTISEYSISKETYQTK
jgi:hypothetical protein